MELRRFMFTAARKYFLIGLVLLILFVSAPFSPAFSQEDIPPVYYQAVCALSCVQCQKGLGTDEMYGFCSKKTFQDLKSCQDKCSQSSTNLNYATSLLFRTCQLCLTANKCPKESSKNYCQAIEHGQDLVYAGLYLYQKKLEIIPPGNTFGCPQGAALSTDGKTCQCPQGEEFDKLHSNCLNKAKITGNLAALLNFLPDDISAALKEKAQKQISESVSPFEKMIPKDLQENKELLAGAAAKVIITNDVIVQYIYEDLISNTHNLRQLIKVLGRTKTERLIEMLELLNSSPKQSQTAAEVENKITPGQKMDSRQLYDFYIELNDKVQKLCETDKQNCYKDCRKLWYTDMNKADRCTAGCNIFCGDCQNDSDCSKWNAQSGYESFCNLSGERAQKPGGYGYCYLKSPLTPIK